jgi:parallel beta-helix repeat protein
LLYGILLEDSSSNIIEKNSITKAINGLILANNRENMFQAVGYYPGSSKDNVIQNNKIYNNTDGGIYLLCWDKASVSNNTIIGNTVSNNEVAVGFGGENVTFSNNTLENNDLGLFLGLPTQHYYTKGWLISDNLIVDNNFAGIVIESSAENSIINNTIYKNGFGLSIETVDKNKAEKNLIRSNDFVRNNVGSDQAADLGNDNVFEKNFWDDWTSPDNNGDGIVDIPYTISNFSKDYYPMVKPNHKRIHLYSPSFRYPNSSEVINGILTVQWLPAIDIEDHLIEYSLYFSSDKGNSWIPLVSGTTSLSYNWDTTSMSDGEYSLKIVALCSDNKEASDIIEFTIDNSIVTTTTQKSSMSGLLILLFSLTCIVKFRSKK